MKIEKIIVLARMKITIILFFFFVYLFVCLFLACLLNKKEEKNQRCLHWSPLAYESHMLCVLDADT